MLRLMLDGWWKIQLTRSGVYKRRILHEHNAEVPPRKRTKGSGINEVKETRKAAVVDLSRGGDSNALNPKGSKCCKRVSTALEPYHPLTWIQRKSHRFGQGAHDCGCKSEQDPAELVLRFKTWALYSVRCPCPNL